MPTTPRFALRYPVPTDPADGPAGFQNLATDVETALVPAVVSTLPASPYDGQEVMYATPAASTLADGTATAGASPAALWHLRYRSSTAGSYKWHFLGGQKLWAAFTAGVNVTPVGSWFAYFPTLRVPLPGVYRAEIFANSNIPAAGYFVAAAVTPDISGNPTGGEAIALAAGNWAAQAEMQNPLTVPNLTQKVHFAVAAGVAGTLLKLTRLYLTPELVG